MKTEANIQDQFDYVSGVTNSFNAIIENLSMLEWNSPTYDDEKPSYNLSFKAPKTADTLDGLFTINHKVTGGYEDSTSENGSLNDKVTASYGTLDKVTGSRTESATTKFDKNDDIISSKHTSSNKLTINSSNNTLDDKSDDFTHTINYSYSDSYTAKTGKTSGTSKESDVYKSTNLNYSISEDSKFESLNDEETSTHSGTGKVTYSNHDLDLENVTTVNLAYSYNSKFGTDNDSSSINFSAADIKIAADDKSSLSALSFSGVVEFNIDVANISLKSFTVETTDLKMVSSAISKTEISIESYDALSQLRYFSQMSSEDGSYSEDDTYSEFSPEESLNNVLAVFQEFNQGDNTITIKTAEGFSVDAGSGADIVNGGAGDDLITGGAGSDKLTGGKGLDTFSFSLSDFFTDKEDKDGNITSVFNKSVDTITDFNLTEGDVLDLGDLGLLDFSYDSLTAAQTDEAQLFYLKGIVYLNTDTTGEKYTATPIINLTGSPAVNAELTDFNYPA